MPSVKHEATDMIKEAGKLNIFHERRRNFPQNRLEKKVYSVTLPPVKSSGVVVHARAATDRMNPCH